jgi:ABC-type uncharacterized transport system substrate-binding protein
MLRRAAVLLLGLCAAFAAGEAVAHPHVWVTSKSQLLYGPKGDITGVRHAWTFDEMFSSYATQGLDKDGDGKLSREELAPLAEVNITSLSEYDFFTFAEAGDVAIGFDKPVDYFLEQVGTQLTLHFTLPVKSGGHGKKIKVEIYDPSFFVDFALAEKEPAVLVGAPAACKLAVQQPGADQGKGKKLTESFFNQLESASEYAEKLAPSIEVRCGP